MGGDHFGLGGLVHVLTEEVDPVSRITLPTSQRLHTTTEAWGLPSPTKPALSRQVSRPTLLLRGPTLLVHPT
jgi:hypothetical protein